jgi:hypothetical protein
VAVHPSVYHDVLDAVSLRGRQVVEDDATIRVHVASGASDPIPADLAPRLALRRRGIQMEILLQRVNDVGRTGASKALVLHRSSQPAAHGDRARH